MTDEPECREVEPLLHGLLDGELDAAHTLKCEQHIAACAACASAYQELVVQRNLIRAANLREAAPERLRRRVRGMLGRKSNTARFMRPFRGAAWPAAAALAAGLLVFAIVPRGPDLGEQVAESHVRSLMANHLVDVVSTDHHTVKPWFAGRLDFSPPIYDLAAQGFTLAGGRVDYLDSRPVAAVVYRHGAHVINLFIWPERAGDAAPVPPLVREGYNVRHWTKLGMSCWAVSDMNAEELARFERVVRASNPV
ncbi:MAG: anti-sigma factor [Proteobacteria bacterium]|nr:anti-sigma factor [Pseudomonadota bacterium]